VSLLDIFNAYVCDYVFLPVQSSRKMQLPTYANAGGYYLKKNKRLKLNLDFLTPDGGTINFIA